ncbi:MAG: flagellar basal body P-ring protein FlgI [Tepidisphaera sp.]
MAWTCSAAPRRHLGTRPLAVLAGLLLATVMSACESDPPPKPRRAEPIVRDVPSVLVNTIGASTTLNGTEPIVVFGYGVVVGLNGTGGGILDEALAAQIELEMNRRDISATINYEGYAINGKSPKEMLRDKNVAVVLVQAAVPPAAPKGLPFDAYVTAINATSLEGGTLWTTDLYIQSGGAGSIGGLRGRRLATARGPVFINPFDDPAAEADGVTRRTGRVLAGGAVVEPLKIEILLDEPSHARTRRMAEAINTRFPEEPGSRGKTAMGRTGDSLALQVPASMVEEAGDFVQIVRHLQIDMSAPDLYAKRYVEAMKEQPWLATELGYCLMAVGGDAAIRFARELYDYPEVVPRITALRVGARLGDHKSAEHLIRTAQTGNGPERFEAIDLLKSVDGGPNIDLALRELLKSRELLVRVTAYEALASRAQGIARRRAMREAAAAARATGDYELTNPTHRDVLLRGAIPGNNIQGVRREIVGDKFQLDIVPYGDPMIYVTQQGQPRIVLFGGETGGMKLEAPMLVSAWEDRLMITAESGSTVHRVYYRDYRDGKTYRHETDGSLEHLVEFFARKSSPEDPRPGLDMTYSEVVGALYALHQARGTICVFATEKDKLKAKFAEATKAAAPRIRPETPEDREAMLVVEQPTAEAVKQAEGRPAAAPRPKIIPVIRPQSPGDKAKEDRQ